MNTLLWFQRDLRTKDNPALSWALQQGNPVIAVYIHSPEEDAPWAAGAASCWWLQQSLEKLSDSLQKLNITLYFFHDDSVKKIPQLAQLLDCDDVVWTGRHEPKRLECESKIESMLKNKAISVQRFNDHLLNKPEQFLTASTNTPYKVFTPFYKKLRAELRLYEFHQSQFPTLKKQSVSNQQNLNNFVQSQLKPAPLNLQQLNLIGTHNWHHKLHNYWEPGEESALQKLQSFVDETICDYATARDNPATNGTSGLSPHLHFGEVSPQQILTALVPLIEIQGDKQAQAAEVFLRQLIWREFARYILWHFPDTAVKPMNKRFKNTFWKQNRQQLTRWQKGETGISLVDAGMKQLWETGWMHNRVRMLVASLLTKNLGISWQQGAHWFWDTLVDADLANNSMGWQWVAGCGVDASPYYRIFNPDTQASKFDKQGSYRHRWLGKEAELKIMNPSAKPIIDLANSRIDALDRYKALKNNNSIESEKA